MRRICWLSAGVSSFIAGYIAGNVDQFIYIDVGDQHPDSMRFIKDCEKVLNKNVLILRSSFKNVEEVCRKKKAVNTPHGAPCTFELKKKVRLKWEHDNPDEYTYIWGFDKEEKTRAERMRRSFPEYTHEFPLIDAGISKEEAHGILKKLGIRRPEMYDLGYPNNNCVGCLKGGMGYWNKIRKDFPEVFEKRAKMERDLCHTILNGQYLDELDPERGRNKIIIESCSLLCEELIDETLPR